MMNGRFNSILMDIQDDEIISLPICNDKTELIFTYHLYRNEDGSACVEEIVNVFSHERASDVVVKQDLVELLKKSGISFDDFFSVNVDGSQAMLLHQRYMVLYEEYYSNSLEHKSDSKCMKMHDELLNLFEQIVPPSPLKNFYFFLGEDFFASRIE